MSVLAREYWAEPTLARFHASDAFVRGVMGPIGSGKSVACTTEILRRSCEQKLGRGGKRRSRWAVVRNTYGELKNTTIRTWQDWIPESVAPFRWDQPIICRFNQGDVELEVIFMSLAKPEDIKKLLSLELTGAWLNEARELPESVVRGVISRVGRYPSKDMGGTNWSGVIMDTNPPDDDHWWYRLAEVERPEGWEFFRQPAAVIRLESGVYVVNKGAENLHNHALGKRYYEQQIPGAKPEWIKVYLMGEYGTVQDGKPVYPGYRDQIHCAGSVLEPMRGIPLFLGFDYGRTPACSIKQYTPRGQVRVIDELYVDPSGEGMGIRTFMREVVMPHLRTKYADFIGRIYARGDPAGRAKGGDTDKDCFQIQAEEGLNVEPAGTNDRQPRTDAIEQHLNRMVDGEPGFLLSPNCKMHRKGFNGGFHYRRIQVAVSGSDSRYQDVPDKNACSHTMEACEYGVMGINEAAGTTPARARQVQRVRRSWV